MPDNRKTKLHKLEYSVFRNLPVVKTDASATRVLAAVSGGADSVAMVHILSRLQKRSHFELEIAYVHHGKSKDKSTTRYRERAAKHVEMLAESLKVPFRLLTFSSLATGKSESEEMMREGRFQALEQYAENSRVDMIALGHHADDLFETRLIRLLRGTGPQGLTAMKSVSVTAEGRMLWRPLIDVGRQEIEIYLAELGLRKNKDWLEDPSNSDARYLRNSIRKKLIPSIERLRPGGVAAMARSLALLAEFVENAPKETSVGEELDRRALLDLNVGRRREKLANWVGSLGVRGFSKAHVDEMLKRIDTPQRSLSFELCGRVWLVGSTIRLSPIGR